MSRLRTFMRQWFPCLIGLTLIFRVFPAFAQNEVIPDTRTEVMVRTHPRTGQSYVAITERGAAAPTGLLAAEGKHFSRPDYRMLAGDVKSGDIPYDGPVSSRKKVYILAGTLAATGVVAGVAGPAIFPAAAGTGTGSGAAGVGAAGVGVSGAAAAGTVVMTNRDIPDDYSRGQQTELLEYETDFYRMHISPADSGRPVTDGGG